MSQEIIAIVFCDILLYYNRILRNKTNIHIKRVKTGCIGNGNKEYSIFKDKVLVGGGKLCFTIVSHTKVSGNDKVSYICKGKN